MTTVTPRRLRRAVVGAIGLVLGGTPGVTPAAHAQLSLQTGINGMREFTSSGAWTAPGLLSTQGVTHVLVVLVGAGGGGAQRGGGAGGCVVSTVRVIPGQRYAVTLGRGGMAGTDAVAGTDGEATAFSFGSSQAVLAQANGGGGADGGLGGDGGGGTVHADGGLVRAGGDGLFANDRGEPHRLCRSYGPPSVGQGGRRVLSGSEPATGGGAGWALLLW